MKALITDYEIEVIPPNKEAEWLASVYVKEGIIKAKYEMDALHIAVATIAKLDFIINLNFQHIVKHKTIFETVRVINGYLFTSLWR